MGTVRTEIALCAGQGMMGAPDVEHGGGGGGDGAVGFTFNLDTCKSVCNDILNMQMSAQALSSNNIY